MSTSVVPFGTFLHIDVRAGTVTRAEPFPEARKPPLKLWIDFGGDIGNAPEFSAYHRPLFTA